MSRVFTPYRPYNGAAIQVSHTSDQGSCEETTVIIVRISAGLGNQLFQYAMGRRLACDRGATLKLDLSDYQKKAPGSRAYLLDYYRIKAEVASPDEVNLFRSRKTGRGLIGRIRHRVTPYYRRLFILEPGHGFDPNFLSVPETCYLQGYWQDERYFESIAPIIRQEFTLLSPPDEPNARLLALIQTTNAVSLHIRRGDYVSVQAINERHGVLPRTYYQNAIARLVEEVSDPHFFIFSDEPEWAEENLKLDCPFTLVDVNGTGRPHEDLRLMSACQHHIIANSTFSWWGAWLGTYQEKRVYAPAQRFRDPTVNARYSFPPTWERIAG